MSSKATTGSAQVQNSESTRLLQRKNIIQVRQAKKHNHSLEASIMSCPNHGGMILHFYRVPPLYGSSLISHWNWQVFQVSPWQLKSFHLSECDEEQSCPASTTYPFAGRARAMIRCISLEQNPVENYHHHHTEEVASFTGGGTFLKSDRLLEAFPSQ